MAKFCGNCGGMLNEGETRCPKCGKVTDEAAAGKKAGRILKALCAIAVIFCIAAVGIRIASFTWGYQGTLSKFEKAYGKYDYEKIVEMYSEAVLYENDYDYTYLEDKVKNKIEPVLSYFDSFVGHSYHLKYEVTDHYEMPNYQFENFKKELSYFEDDNDNAISKALVVELQITAEGKNKNAERNVRITLTKEDGKWKIADFN